MNSYLSIAIYDIKNHYEEIIIYKNLKVLFSIRKKATIYLFQGNISRNIIIYVSFNYK